MKKPHIALKPTEKPSDSKKPREAGHQVPHGAELPGGSDCHRPSIDEMLAEDKLRTEALAAAEADYDPLRGRGSFGYDEDLRVAIKSLDPAVSGTVFVPRSMLTETMSNTSSLTAEEWIKLRCRHDFEYWAARCVTIRDKTSSRDIPFRLNRPQRRVLGVLERQRLAGEPMRIIMLKARQWGGSTLVQLYMAWIQCCLIRNRNSLICSHLKDTSSTIRGIYSRMLAAYPPELWDGDEAPQFRSFERSQNIREIAGRGCRVAIASSESQDSVRGGDYALAHLSEVAFWKSTPQSSPEQAIRAICGAINSTPLTLIALESTANGVGNYFHREWVRSEARLSDKEPIFVPWHEIGIYTRDPGNVERLRDEMDDYEWQLWESARLTLAQIAWYHGKRREYPSHSQMQAEYPSTAVEAFTAGDANVFRSEEVERLRGGCTLAAERGEVYGDAPSGPNSARGVHFVASSKGRLCVWKHPEPSPPGRRYVAVVDVGGRSAKSDWSVVAVIDRRGADDKPEVVAQWRGHIDHDLLAWIAVQIASYYCNALLVFESNTFETDNIDGDPSTFILNEVSDHYHNLYYRVDGSSTARVGFHTNRFTKSEIISNLILSVREHTYVERDDYAINELLTYRVTTSGSFAAMDGCHDDILMTRAIGLYVIRRSEAEQAISDRVRPLLHSYAAHFKW